MSRSRYRFCELEAPHFMTCTIVAWLPVFATRRFANIIFESWQYLQTKRSIEIIAYVLMENHLHWIATGPDLGKRVGEFKSYTARTIIDTMKKPLDPSQDSAAFFVSFLEVEWHPLLQSRLDNSVVSLAG